MTIFQRLMLQPLWRRFTLLDLLNSLLVFLGVALDLEAEA